MNYITVKEASEKWGISARRVQILCSQGRIAGTVRFGNRLMIPTDAEYPIREKNNNGDAAIPFPRCTPFLYMTDLYSVPGSAEKSIEALAGNYEVQTLFAAEIAYLRGEIDKVYETANYLLSRHSDFYATLSAGMLLALCAIWRGDLEMWRRAKVHIAGAPAKDDRDRDIISFSITAADSMLYDIEFFPEWFKLGCFEPLHKDSLPAAMVFYARYLYAASYATATKQIELDGLQRLSLMSIVSFTIEPMVSQAIASNSVIAEILLRLTCATVYHNSGNDQQAIRHIDRAIALALPDKLYGLLAEHCRVLDSLLELRLTRVDPDAWNEVKKLYKTYHDSYAKLSGSVRGRTIITTLSPKEREVAKLAAFGMQYAEIAERANMSLSGVKQTIKIVSEKTGMDRKDFAAIL